MPDGLSIRTDNGVAWVTLANAAKANSLTRAIYEGLCTAWAWVKAEPAVRVVVFSADGDRHFCSGADVSALQDPESFRHPDERWTLTWRQAGVTKPVIVAVNGAVAGGGLGFVTDGDIVVASRNARFIDTHVAIGQIVGYGALRLVGIIGRSEAVRVGIAGGALSAERAHTLGLVNELYDTPDEARQAAADLAARIVTHSPAAVAETFRLQQAMDCLADERRVLRDADRTLVAHWNHPDAAEGPRAWMERRPPTWSTLEQTADGQSPTVTGAQLP